MYSDPEHPRQLPEQKQRRDAEEAPVEAVDHAPVRPERAPEILDPAPPLHRARGEVAHGPQHAHEQALPRKERNSDRVRVMESNM